MPDDLLIAYRKFDTDTQGDGEKEMDLSLVFGGFEQTREEKTETPVAPLKWEGDVPPDLSDGFDFLL